MRQNREQLLAKQQILEQYARSQKQLQMQQRSSNLPQKLPQHQIPSSSTSTYNNYRSSHSSVERVISLPPGLCGSEYSVSNQNSRHGVLPDRPMFHRPINPQRSVPPQMQFGGLGFSGTQSRSASDIRMDMGLIHQDRGQFGEQNTFFEQLNLQADGRY